MNYLRIIQEMKALTWAAKRALMEVDEDKRIDELFQFSFRVLNKLNEIAPENRKVDIVLGTRELIAQLRNVRSDADEDRVDQLITALNECLHVEELSIINISRRNGTYSFVASSQLRKG